MIIVAITGGNVALRLTSSKSFVYNMYIMNHLVYVDSVLYTDVNFSQELWKIPILTHHMPFFRKTFLQTKISFLSLNWCARDVDYTP